MGMKPKADRQSVFIVELAGETIIYMKRLNHAARLDADAARVWRLCSGERSIDEIVLASQIAQEDVTAIVARLGSAGLLADVKPASELSEDDNQPDPGRRNAIFELARAGAVIGAVAMIPVPAAAQSASCFGSGSICSQGSQCCSGFCAFQGAFQPTRCS